MQSPSETTTTRESHNVSNTVHVTYIQYKSYKNHKSSCNTSIYISSCLAHNSSQGAKQRASTMTHGYKHSWLSLSQNSDTFQTGENAQGQLRFKWFEFVVFCIFSWNPAKPCTECYEVRFQREVLGLRSTVENVLEMSFEVHWPRLPLECKKSWQKSTSHPTSTRA